MGTRASVEAAQAEGGGWHTLWSGCELRADVVLVFCAPWAGYSPPNTFFDQLIVHMIRQDVELRLRFQLVASSARLSNHILRRGLIWCCGHSASCFTVGR